MEKRSAVILIIIIILLGILIFISYAFYKYFKSPEQKLGLGAEIEQVLISEDGKTAYIKLAGGSLDKNITKIKFIFNDLNENEYNYETFDGVQEIEVPYSRSFWDWLFGRQFVGGYDYEINSSEVGIDNFGGIKDIDVSFEYQTETGDVIETLVLDTQRTTNRTTTTGDGDRDDGGDDGTTPTPSCTPKTCSDYEGQCGNSLSDDCGGSLNCRSSCINGTYCYIGEEISDYCINNSITCIDSDNGLNYYLRGNVTINNLINESVISLFEEDFCSINLTEYYCYYNGTSFEARNESYECGYGCLDGKCELPLCTSDINCPGLSGVCGIGKCNLTSGSCYINYSIGNICRNNTIECGAVEYCSGSSSECPADINKSDGTGCVGGSCLSGECVLFPTCNDGIQNQDETDVDCGGSCPACTNGKNCSLSSDCLSNNCTNNICVEISGCTNCSDMDFRTVALWAYPDSNTVSGTVNIGLVAYDANGIQRVDFNVSGTIYSVYEETINPDTDEYEYVLNLDTTTLDGRSYNITAIVYDDGSENYTFWPITIQVDNNPNYNNFYADSINGDDLNDGSSLNPFKTLNKSIARASSGDNIYLRDGNYTISASQIPIFNRYTTIMPDVGANPVILEFTINWRNYLKFVNLTFDISQKEGNLKNYYIIKIDNSNHLWFNGCRFIGLGAGFNNIPGAFSFNYASQYMTIEKCKFEKFNLVMGLSSTTPPFQGIIRQNEIHSVYGDAFDVNADALVTGNIIHDIEAPYYYIESKNSGTFDLLLNNIFNIYYDEYNENTKSCTSNNNCTYSGICEADNTCLGYYEMNFDLSSLGTATNQEVADFLNNDVNFMDKLYASNEYGYLRITALRNNAAQWIYVNGSANNVFGFSENSEDSTYAGAGQHSDIFQNWLSYAEEAAGKSRENIIIRNNRAYNIYAQGFLTQADTNGLIFINNMINIQSDSFALGFADYHYANTLIEHNTIWGGGNSQYFPAVIDGDNFIMRNNIFGPIYGKGDNTNNKEVIMDYNVYDYSTSQYVSIADHSTDFNPDNNVPTTTSLFKNVAAEYVTHLFCDTCPSGGLPLDLGVLSDPGYQYSGDFHLSTDSVARNFGTPNSTIKYDIDWEIRDSYPDAGADEFNGSCTTPSSYSLECVDGNPCTDDICTSGFSCSNPYNTNLCSDGLFCTGTETCQIGSCVASGNPCTTQQLCFEPNICQDVDYSTDYKGYWRFEGNADDETGTYNGDVFGNPKYVSGKQGQALEFNGTNDYVETYFNGTEYDGLTILAWVNTKDVSRQNSYIIDNSPWNSGGFGFIGYYNDFDFWVVNGFNMSDIAKVRVNDILALNTWVHLVGVHNRTDNVVYINGVKSGSKSYITASGIADSNDLTVIGASHNQDRRYMWNGTIDEVMIYNRALSESEIFQIYESQGGEVSSLSPFTKIWNFLKALLTRKTANAILTGKTINGNVVRNVTKLNIR